MTADLAGWGRFPRHHSNLLAPHSVAALCALQASLDNYVARGAGRAYGDAAIGLGSTVGMGALNRMLDFDPVNGLLTVEAGVTLEQVIDTLLPRGWFVPAVPGTRFVTVGGMAAADVHRKNHHRTGGFGEHVASLLLLPPRGELLTCSRSENRALFDATIGGMGLTGAIVEVTLRLIRVEFGWIRQRTVATTDLEATLAALAEAEAEATYSVAWVDASPDRRPLGRGVVLLGEHALAAELPEGKPIIPPRRGGRLSIPVELPDGIVNRWSVGAFNTLYHCKAALRGDADLVRWDSYFFPLDAIGDWNRMYGQSGFLQHQCVVPLAAGLEVVAEILQRVAAAGCAPLLAVLKSLGAGTGDLSFPMPGLTLTLDLRVTPQALGLLDELDRIVVAAGGRLYLAKDARQSPDTFRAGYPGLAAFEALRREIGAVGGYVAALRKTGDPMNNASSVLVVGGASDIGRATALIYADRGWNVMLAGRNIAECERNADDIAVRTGRRPDVMELDILRTDDFAIFVDGLPELPDTVVCVVGLLGDQARDQSDPIRAALTIRSNFEGPALLLEALAPRMAARGRGVIVGISSVAGERGRSSNYFYGSAKAGFSTFLSGLRHRLVRQGVCVITVKPGFVRTQMTAHMKLPRRLTAEPEEVAEAIFSADQAKRPRSLYVRSVWRPIMTIIRILPEPLFLRTRF